MDFKEKQDNTIQGIKKLLRICIPTSLQTFSENVSTIVSSIIIKTTFILPLDQITDEENIMRYRKLSGHKNIRSSRPKKT